MRAFGPAVRFRANRSGYNVLRIAVAVVLLTAAGLKTHQLATEPIVGTSILDSRWLLMATVEFELFFGLWLLANLMPRATWAAALGCFAAFTCVSLYKALSGYASCGCFGRVPVNPWYTTTLDLAIVLSLLRWRPRGLSPLPSGEGKGEGHHDLPSPACGRGAGGEGVPFFSGRLAVISVLWLVIGLPAAYAMGSYTDTTLSDAGDIIGDGKIVVLEPEEWISKRFPLLEYIDISDELKEGKWLVVLYHHDCPNCQAILRKYKQLSPELASHSNSIRVALIEIWPYGENNSQPVSPDIQCLAGRLNNAKKWFVATPVEIILDRAIVIKVTDGKNTMARSTNSEVLAFGG